MASSSSTSLLSFSLLLLLSLLSFSTAQTLTKAAGILSGSGYSSMSVVLDLASHSLTSPSPSLTVFSPADSAFSNSGYPSLNLIRLHLIPSAFPLRSLKSLPLGAKIPTLLAGHSLTVTTRPGDRHVSLNNITVAPIFDDGSFVVYGVHSFFDRDFWISSPIVSLGCSAPRNFNGGETAAFNLFSEASKVLRSQGCSVMASFLEIQVHGFVKDQIKLTVLAPVDQVMASRIGDLNELPSVLRRHVVPCRLSWRDLKSLEDGTVLKTHLEGYVINVSRYDGVLALNAVAVIVPEMYKSGWLVVHGVGEVLGPEQSPTLSSEVESEAEPNPVDEPVFSSPPSPAVPRSSGEVLGLPALAFMIVVAYVFVYCKNVTPSVWECFRLS